MKAQSVPLADTKKRFARVASFTGIIFSYLSPHRKNRKNRKN